MVHFIHLANWTHSILFPLVQMVNMVYFVHFVIAILDNFIIKKSRKHFIETITFIKIPFVFKNLVKS